MSMSCHPDGTETGSGPRKGRLGKSDWGAAECLSLAAAPTEPDDATLRDQAW
jgi:hypothetical protein